MCNQSRLIQRARWARAQGPQAPGGPKQPMRYFFHLCNFRQVLSYMCNQSRLIQRARWARAQGPQAPGGPKQPMRYFFICVIFVKFLATRGWHSEEKMKKKIGSRLNGNYLGVLELLSKFDPFLAEHIKKYGNRGKGNPSFVRNSLRSWAMFCWQS